MRYHLPVLNLILAPLLLAGLTGCVARPVVVPGPEAVAAPSPSNNLECSADDNVVMAAQVGGRSVTVSGDSLLYNPAESGIALIGHAVVNQEEVAISGERIDFDHANALVTVRGAGKLDGTSAPGSERPPFNVAWTGGMTFKTDTRESAFEQDVKLDYGGRILTADRMVGTVDENGALQGFTATGNVRLLEEDPESGETRSLSADSVQGKMGTGRVLENPIAEGNAPMPEPEVGNSTKVVSVLESLVAKGHVVLTVNSEGWNTTMCADDLNARVDAENTISEFEATGRRVKVEQSEGVAEGKRLVWNLKENKGVLFGSPVVFSQDRNRLIGDRIEFSRGEGNIRVISDTGRVEGILIRDTKSKSDPLF